MKKVNAIPINHPQRSEEWHQARLGYVTASMVKVLFEFNKNGTEKATRANYRKQKVAEIIYGMRVDEDKYVSQAMLWGQVSEDFAKTMYQVRTGQIINEAVFKKHPNIRCGASADGLIGDRTTVEIKCLTPANHVFNVMLDPQAVIGDYYDQIQMQMWIEDREQCVFIGADSRAPDGLKLYSEVIERDDKRIKQIEEAIIAFNAEVDRDVKKAFAVAKGYKEAGII